MHYAAMTRDQGDTMSKLDLYAQKIEFEGKWLSVSDLAKQIQENIDAGKMKVAGLAAALERLNTALENSHCLEVSLVISKNEYDQLKSVGGMDDRECVRKAIMSFIGYDTSRPAAEKKQMKKRASTSGAGQSTPAPPGDKSAAGTDAPVRCFQCKTLLDTSVAGAKDETHCPVCSAAQKKDASGDNDVRYKDHFLG